MSQKQSIFIKNLRYIVTCDAQDRVLKNCNVLMENGQITYLGNEQRPADQVLDGSHMIMYPGLINTHHHLYQIFSRNLPQVQKMELFPWLRYLYEIWKNIDEEVVYYSTLVGVAELMKNGCTTCFDHHYVFPKNHENLIDFQFQGADQAGIRFHASRGSMDLGVKDGGLPPDSVVQNIDEILQDSRRVIEKYHDSSVGAMHQVALAPCSPFSVSEALLVESEKLARSYGVRLHTHLAETKDEERYMLEREGMRPLEYMKKLNWVGEDVWFAHGIHFNKEELQLLKETKTGAAHCPISNMKLSSGVAQITEMLHEGISVGLAVDGSASNDGSNLLEEMRVAYLLHRLNKSADAPDGYDILKIATVGGAKVLGRNDIGSIEVGKQADCFLIDIRKLELVGALEDPKAMLATIGYKQPVDYTIVAGKITVANGHLTNVDEEKLYADASRVVRRYLDSKI